MKLWASLIASTLNVGGLLGVAIAVAVAFTVIGLPIALGILASSLAALGFGMVIQLLAAIHSELEHGVDVLKWQRRGANRIAAAESRPWAGER